MSQSVRVRFAPSPTGWLHVGGLRTALYNYLFARKNGGSFVLRIENTDKKREVEGAEQQLMESLRWAGLDWDEGPDKGGAHGPYRQSERLELYRVAAEALVENGHAYHCYRTDEEVQSRRKEHQKEKRHGRIDYRMSESETAERKSQGMPSVIRLKVPNGETLTFHDLVRGDVSWESDNVDDQVLIKSDGFPTYHLANVVDDHAMKISHVIRGEEWVSSTPKHVLLYRALGYDLPAFAHLPLLVNADRSKLSKRQGDVAVEDYRDKDYFADALLNFVALLGWNPGDDREVFSLDELVDAFSLERVNKSGAFFNLEKLAWLNQEYLRKRPAEEILVELRPLLETRGWSGFDDGYVLAGIDLMKERVTFVRDYPVNAPWLFEDPAEYDEATKKKRWKSESGARMARLVPKLEELSNWDESSLEQLFHTMAEAEEVGAGQFIHPVRLATTGMGKGPGLYELLAVLGRGVCVRRISAAVKALG